MKLKWIKRLGLVAAASLISTAASAQLVLTQNQTVDGQDFTFNFATTGTPTGPGLLTLLIRGDFSGNFPGNESYDFDLEGVVGGTNLGLNTGTFVESFGFDDNVFTQSFALSLAQLSTLTADNQVLLNVNYAPGVSASFSANPSITATLDFPSTVAAVPEPATWAMMLVGFGAMGTTLRRRRKAAGLAIS